MDNSELLKTLNQVATTQNKVKREEIQKNRTVQQKQNQEKLQKYNVFISEFKNALVDLVKSGDFKKIDNIKHIEGKIVFEKSTDLDDGQETFYTKVYGQKRCIKLSRESYLGLFANKLEIRSFMNFFNHSLDGIAKIYDYEDCECFKRKYESILSRIFYYRADF